MKKYLYLLLLCFSLASLYAQNPTATKTGTMKVRKKKAAQQRVAIPKF